MELYIQGKRTDLAPDQVFAVTVQSNDITQPDTVQSSYSNTITLPFTATNHAVLGHAAEPTSQHAAPYRKLDALVLQDGVEVVAHPKVFLEQAGEGYDVQIFSGALDFFARLGDKSIRELDLSRFNHIWNYENVKAGAQYGRDYSQGYTYDAIDNGKPFTVGNLWAEDRHPSVFVRTIFEQILTEAGVSYSGIDDELWDRLIIPFSSEKIIHNEAWLAAHRFESLYPKPGGGDIYVHPPVLDYGIFKMKLKMNVTYLANTTSARVVFILRKGTVERKRQEFVIVAPGENEFEGEFTIEPTESIEGFEASVVTFGLGPEAPGTPSGMSHFDTSTATYTIDYEEEVFFKTEWDLALNLPDIKQKDLFKTVRSLFDLMPRFDAYNNTMHLVPFNRVPENIPSALDWSDKLVHVEGRKPAVQYRFGEFAQKSWWRYKEDKLGGNGDHFLTVDDHQLEPDKNIVELPFAASEDRNGFLRIPIFQREKKPLPSGFPAANPPKMVVDYYDQIGELPQITSALVLVRYAAQGDARVISGWAVYRINRSTPTMVYDLVDEEMGYTLKGTEPRIAVLKPESQALNLRSSMNSPEPVTGRASAFLPISFAELLPTRYMALQGVLTRCKGVTPFFLLSAQDVANYDPAVPVWLNQYQDYYYLNSVIEFTGLGPTECQLWRL